MSNLIHLQTPVQDNTRLSLRAGDEVRISGTIYTGRDAAHLLMNQAINENKELPFSFEHQMIYYVGPTPAKPGMPIGSCGPTSSYRMDKLSVPLMENGLKMMIGKGNRSEAFRQELIKNQAVYFIAIGGVGALLSKTVKSSKLLAYPHLQSEAIYELEVEDFPAIVAIDSLGNDLFNQKSV